MPVMSLDPVPVTEVPLQRKLTKSRLQRGDSDSSTSTTTSQTSRDMATQTIDPDASPPPATEMRNMARMSGGASSDKSVSFSVFPPAFYSSGERRDSGLDFVHDRPMQKSATTRSSSANYNKNDSKSKVPDKRPTFKRNLSSFWRMLDPPELANNSGVLHNLVKTEDEEYRGRKKSAEGMTLVETMSSRRDRQR